MDRMLSMRMEVEASDPPRVACAHAAISSLHRATRASPFLTAEEIVYVMAVMQSIRTELCSCLLHAPATTPTLLAFRAIPAPHVVHSF